MSIVVVIGVLLLALLIFSRKDAFMLKMTLLVVELVLCVVTALAVHRADDIFLQIPGTSIENAAVIEIGRGGAMYLDSSQSAYMDNKFYLTDAVEQDLTSWLESTQKNIFLYVVQGSKIIYKKNLGTYEAGMEASVRSIYSSWKETGVVPSDSIRYWFLFFYLEV